MAENEEAVISFRTRRLWTTDELAIFVRSVGGLYNALFTVRILKQHEIRRFESLNESLLLFERSARSPVEFELLHLWRDLLRTQRKSGKPSTTLVPPWPFAPEEVSQALPRTREVFDNLAFYVPEGELLHIRRIEMASPGGVSFQGLGEVVRELRELLKDVWFRNKQERVRGELDILKSYLDITVGHPDTPIPLPQYLRDRQYLLERSTKNIAQLRQLEASGKLEPVASNLDHTPKRTAG
jgi:hypothetical protein